MMSLPKLAISLAALTASISVQAACERHVYNNSNYTWFIEYVPGGVGGPSGGVWFGDFCGDVHNGKCALPPHSVMTITYTTTAGVTSLNIGLKDPTGAEQIFYVSSTGSTCPRLPHDGNTGGAAVNDPADGDISIYSYAWDTSVQPPPPNPNGGGRPDVRIKPMPARPVPDGKTGTVTATAP